MTSQGFLVPPAPDLHPGDRNQDRAIEAEADPEDRAQALHAAAERMGADGAGNSQEEQREKHIPIGERSDAPDTERGGHEQYGKGG